VSEFDPANPGVITGRANTFTELKTGCRFNPEE
jgi:hypothetical protein